jgi:molybdopterin-containing oxidoreductase family membrane subunit
MTAERRPEAAAPGHPARPPGALGDPTPPPHDRARPHPPVVEPGLTADQFTDQITSIVLQRPPLGWYAGFFVAFLLVLVLLTAVTYLLLAGIGIWGVNIPVAWGMAIANFVWWIGIGHAGTLISAILLLLRQEWRTSINRFAEAMTIFAVAQAGLFPLLHLGRPWFFYWLVPYPATTGVWPQFRSPLVWDFFAVSTYFTVSVIFWYLGMVPDLATVRDRARTAWTRITFGILALGWRGAASHWRRYQQAYYLLAALATPLVVSVHSVVSFDFAVSLVPGWHSTIFPPYFVAGALFSGFAMVLTIAIPLRAAYRFQSVITLWHIESMAKIMLATGLVVGYAYVVEWFIAWYSGNLFERFLALNRAFGPYAVWYGVMIACNVLLVQLLWFRRVRTNLPALFVIALLINFGMWAERFVIVVTSLHRDFLPSSWGFYSPTIWDVATFVGTLGLFTALMFLFIRLLPVISTFELRELLTTLERRNGRP